MWQIVESDIYKLVPVCRLPVYRSRKEKLLKRVSLTIVVEIFSKFTHTGKNSAYQFNRHMKVVFGKASTKFALD
jgi:hypothetical protein